VLVEFPEDISFLSSLTKLETLKKRATLGNKPLPDELYNSAYEFEISPNESLQAYVIFKTWECDVSSPRVYIKITFWFLQMMCAHIFFLTTLRVVLFDETKS
jgi:hypothetical protein